MLPNLKPQSDGQKQTETIVEARDFTPRLRNSSHTRVLVVDDDSLLRWSLAETLGIRGYDVAEATDAASAISAVLAPHRRIAVVLLDLYLPDASDFRMLKALRQMSPNTPVILMTAHGGPELAAEALRIGAFIVLDKPFELDDVAPLVERAVASCAQ